MSAGLDFAWRLLVIASLSSTLMFGAFFLVRAGLRGSARAFAGAAKATALGFLALMLTSALLLLLADREWTERCFGVFTQTHDGWAVTRWLALLWMGTASLLFLRDLARHALFMRGLHGPFQNASFELTAISGEKIRVPLRVHESAASPFCAGVFRSRIVVPPWLLLDGDSARDMISHEYLHRRHRDGWWNLVVLAVLRLCWFQPLAWGFGRSYRLAIELAADQGAIRDFGLDPGRYARTLLAVLERAGRGPSSPLAAAGVLDFEQLEARFRHLRRLDEKSGPSWRLRLSLVVLALGALSGWQQALASMHLSARTPADARMCAQVRHELKIEDWLRLESRETAQTCEPSNDAGSPYGRCE